jgi:hypothetical protein
MKVTKLLALAVVLGMVGVAVAAEGDAPKRTRPPGLRGKVVSVDTTAKTVTIMKYARAEADRKEVTVDASAAVVTLDGEASSLDKLAKDMYVTITPETGKAEKIVALTKMPEHKKKPADAPKPE